MINNDKLKNWNLNFTHRGSEKILKYCLSRATSITYPKAIRTRHYKDLYIRLYDKIE